MPCCSMGNVVTKILHFLMYVHRVLALFLNAYMHAYSVFSHYICNIFTTTKQLIHTLTEKKGTFPQFVAQHFWSVDMFFSSCR